MGVTPSHIFDFVPSLRGFLEPIEKSLYHYQCNLISYFQSQFSGVENPKGKVLVHQQHRTRFGLASLQKSLNVLKMFEARKMSNANAFIFELQVQTCHLSQGPLTSSGAS